MSWRKGRATEAKGELEKEEGKRGDKLQKEGGKGGVKLHVYRKRGEMRE